MLSASMGSTLIKVIEKDVTYLVGTHKTFESVTAFRQAFNAKPKSFDVYLLSGSMESLDGRFRSAGNITTRLQGKWYLAEDGKLEHKAERRMFSLISYNVHTDLLTYQLADDAENADGSPVHQEIKKMHVSAPAKLRFTQTLNLMHGERFKLQVVPGTTQILCKCPCLINVIKRYGIY